MVKSRKKTKRLTFDEVVGQREFVVIGQVATLCDCFQVALVHVALAHTIVQYLRYVLVDFSKQAKRAGILWLLLLFHRQ